MVDRLAKNKIFHLKKINMIKYYLALIILMGGCNSCVNSSAEKNTAVQLIQAEKATYLSANVNNIAWQANHEIQSYSMDKTIVLGGEDDNWVMGINIPDNVTAGQTLNVDASVAKKMKGSSNILYNAEIAVIKITNKSATSMEGNFSFTGIHANGKEKVTVENGKFKTALKKL
jgi:hypothetical protein